MDEKEEERLKALRDIYENSIRVCDPFAFLNRKKILLDEIARIILEPLYEHEEKMKKNDKTDGMD